MLTAVCNQWRYTNIYYKIINQNIWQAILME